MNDNICWDILDTYFQKGSSPESVNPLVKHQIDSYNKFIDNTLSHIITGFNPIKIQNTLKNENGEQSHKIYINVSQPSLTKPSYHLHDGTQTVMTPYIARLNKLTYSSSLYINVNISIEVINKDGIIEKFNKTINGVYIGKIPIMVRSKACILQQMPALGEENNNECRYDYGGYFIINGSEKVLISQDRINENKTLVFQPNNNSEGLYAEIRSMSDASYLPPKTTSLNMSGKLNHMGRIIRMSTSFIRSEIPVFVMFRALGIISDKEIISHIVYDLDNKDNQRIITELMACCEDASEIHTQQQAEASIIKIMIGANKTNNPVELLRNNIINDFLPHVGKNYRRKALYLGFMIRKMIRIYLGYDNYDNRDSYMNKRIDTPGILMSNLFRQCYGKMTKEIKTHIERELNLWRSNQTSMSPIDIINDNNIHRYFRQSLLESWLKYSLSTGNWGIKSIGSFQNIRQGVSQVLNRMSYASTLSHLRRINTAMEKNGKLVQPRKLDHSQMGMICPAECFDPNTPILLWNGTIKKAQDIIVGDYLIDDNGNVVRVKSTCSGEKMMYEVVQHKKNFLNHTVTDNHILTLKIRNLKNARNHRGKIEFSWLDKKELKYKSKYFNNTEDLNEFSSSIDDDNIIDITIEKYLSLPKNVQKQLYTFKSNGINWETKEVALDPYILGMWLGDGLSSGTGFITADKELLDVWTKWGVDNDATITKNKQKYRYTFSSTINNTQSGISCNKTEKAPLKKLLDKYGLVNNKHIPLDYLTNDRKTRLAVLAGLIDTDGSVRANGHEIRICQGEPNYKIIYDAEFLARSLGFSCHLNNGMCSYTVNSEKRQKPYKELSITGKYLYEIQTVLPRKKLNKCNDSTHEKRCDSSLQSSFELVQKDIQPYVGWQLDGNGRFLLGDMSIVHNTPEGASVGLVKNMALSINISVSMNSTHIRDILIEKGVHIYNDELSYKVENDQEWFNDTEYIKEKRDKIMLFLKNIGNTNNVYVQVNGDIIGYHTDPVVLYQNMKHYKRCGLIHPMTGVVWDINNRIISITTEAGRMYRPLLIVDIDKKTGKRELRIAKILREKNITWEEFNKDKIFDNYLAPCTDINNKNYEKEEEGFIEYLDSDEINHSMLAMNKDELEKGKMGTAYPPFYTHCEIHPSLMNGILGANIPFSDHNQSPRNCYQCLSENEKVLMSNGTYKMIKNIKIGDEVVCFDINTHTSYHTRVINNYNRHTTKIVYNINTVSGRTITATYDHKFMTNQGWKTCMEFGKDTLIGIHLNTHYDYDNTVSDLYTIIGDNEFISPIYEELNLIPLKNDNKMMTVIAKLAGYYYKNKLDFVDVYNRDTYNRDVMYIGFKDYGLFDTRFIVLMNKLVEDIKWIYKCSNMVQIEFLSGYLSAVYPNSLDGLLKSKELNTLVLDDFALNLLENEGLNDWFINNITMFYKKIGLRYNYKLLNDIAIIGEYNSHKQYCGIVNIDKIRKVYSNELWNMTVYIKGDLIFVPFNIIYKNKNNKISDITVENDNHCFIGGNGFAVSNCAMGKQALGIYASNFNKRIDTMGNILNYVQKPLVNTKLSKYTYSNELPSGINAVVAIMIHTGFNQEDSVMINQSSLDRGLFTSTYYKSVKDQCAKNHSTGEEEKFTNPLTAKAVAPKPFSYEKLDDNGFVPKNTYINGNDIIIGKVMPKKTNGVIVNQDNSVPLKANDDGYVDMNYVGTNSEGYKFCNVRIRKNRKPEIGDKLASRSAQKGTVGMVYKEQDMPFTKDGIKPDIIMNPHAVPSRMTMAQLMECIMGKSCCHLGTFGDATPFTDCSVESISKVLELSGMERYGNEIMYNGRTGEQIHTAIFIGPTYYQRLKHMVLDKIHCVKGDHEVLTSGGWKFIPQVTLNDKVAILKDGKMVYEHPLEVHHYPNYKGKMYRIKNSSIDLDVTANHRMYIKTCHTRNQIWSDYRLEKAEDIYGKMVKYKKNAEWNVPEYQFVLPTHLEETEKIVDMKSWITFFGIWMAEGWAHNGNTLKYRVNISINKQRVKDVLYDAVAKLGYNYSVYSEKLEISNKQLHAYMSKLSVGAPNKRLPEWVWELSQEQARQLLYSMQLGDGSFCKNEVSSVYYTSSTGLADDFMRLCLHAGWSGTKSVHIKAGENNIIIKGREVCNNYDIWRIAVIKTKNEPSANHSHHKNQEVQEEEIYDYEGAIYCLSVSSEVFMVRRNGKCVWTGNSRGSNGPIVMLTRQPSEGRARCGGLRLGEMERDCLIGHGISEFLKEKMLDTADNYRLFMCKNCGMTANANPNKNIYKCTNCRNSADIVQVRIPYAFKLLGQELYTMNIKMGFICN